MAAIAAILSLDGCRAGPGQTGKKRGRALELKGGSVHLGLGAQRVSQLKRATLGTHEEAISSPPMLLPLLHRRRYCYRYYYYIVLIIITIVTGGHHTRLRS